MTAEPASDELIAQIEQAQINCGGPQWVYANERALIARIREQDAKLAERDATNKRMDEVWRENMQAQAAAMRIVRQTVEYVFGPAANLPSEEAILSNGPEPHHEAEAIASALVQVKARHNDEIAAARAARKEPT